MKQTKRIILIISISFIFSNLLMGQEFQPENIDRGPVAVAVQDVGVYIGWRLLASGCSC